MAISNPQRRRRSRLGLLPAALFSLLLVGGGSIFTVWALGLAPWGGQTNPYLVRIPVNARAIPAYKRVARIDLIDPKAKSIRFQELPPRAAIGRSISGANADGKAVTGKVVEVLRQDKQLVFVVDTGDKIPHSRTEELGGALVNVARIIGRVVKKDKAPGLGFRESSFFPKGTPEGIAGATPQGMQSFVVEANGLKGIHTLPAGARIDLIANVPLADLPSFEGGNGRSSVIGRVRSGNRSTSRKGRTEPILLAQKAIILRPVYRRSDTNTSSSLLGGQQTHTKAVLEVALAVQQSDVIPLQSALSKKLSIICVAHSMQPATKVDRPPTRTTDELAPVTARSILAYEVLGHRHFHDAATRRVRHEPATPEEIKRLKIVTSLRQLIGTVVKHDIPEGSFITEADLLNAPQLETPSSNDKTKQVIRNGNHQHDTQARHSTGQLNRYQFVTLQRPTGSNNQPQVAPSVRHGSRPNIVGEIPGISRFVPPGHKAVAIPWNRLYGAEYLKLGDTVDLTVTYTLEHKAESKEVERQPDGTVVERTIKRRAKEPSERTYDETLGFRGESWLAAVDAKVIGPVGFPPPAAAARFLGDALNNVGNQKEKGRAGPPILFAIEERDLEALSTAMISKDATFTVVIHPQSSKKTALGWKRVVLAPQGIASFKQLTEADLKQRHTRRWLTRLVRTDDPSFKDALTATEIQNFVGRVLRSYKNRHTFFTATDFLPEGTQPGFTAAIGKGSAVYVADDRDIDGLQHFSTNDSVAILFRAVLKQPEGVIAHGMKLQRPVSTVVVPRARIIRASQEGKTVLEIRKTDLTRLQAFWAKAFTTEKSNDTNKSKRLHLMAVSISQSESKTTVQSTTPRANTTAKSSIPDFDPATKVRTLEVIVGSRTETHIFPSKKP